jgi:hypothetical protein
LGLRHCEFLTRDNVFFDSAEIHFYHFLFPQAKEFRGRGN